MDFQNELQLDLKDFSIEEPYAGHDDRLHEDLQLPGVFGQTDDVSGIEPLLISDPYRELDDVTRGLTLQPSSLDCDGTFGSPFEELKSTAFDMHGPGSLTKPGSGVLARAACSVQIRAADGLPLQASSVFLGAVGFAVAFEALQEYFQTAQEAAILKMKPQKGTMKVTVRHKGAFWAGDCEMKIRLWIDCEVSGDFGTQYGLAAEFQRREGDPLVFTHSFSKVKAFLQSLAAPLPPSPETLVKLPEDPQLQDLHPTDVVTEEEMQPVVDMLTNEQCPRLQKEAANALAVIAGTAVSAARAVCRALHPMSGLFRGLLTNPAFDVACPAAQLAAVLPTAHCSTALASTLLEGSLDAVSKDCTEQVVREALATVIVNVLGTFVFDSQVVKPAKLLPALTDAAEKPFCQAPAVAAPLREAIALLDSDAGKLSGAGVAAF
eukprot:TRINITY_DN81000_c0_g1_i1.p1 TRINITY_DN81000_c0_g1~~TRINITY_DN81000_c0_g1_i1.p1  ORF type:complete len:462 (-),score=73.82 TRINITY_DN81000_c0_g1_i1:197-1501(-)